jgi:hypothetical protein
MIWLQGLLMHLYLSVAAVADAIRRHQNKTIAVQPVRQHDSTRAAVLL